MDVETAASSELHQPEVEHAVERTHSTKLAWAVLLLIGLVATALALAKPHSTSVESRALSENESVSVTAAAAEGWRYGVCEAKDQWNAVKTQCDGCKVLVDLTPHENRCGKYCESQGLQCHGAWGSVSESCQEEGWYQCSEPVERGSAICECITPCSASGDSCSDNHCCSSTSDSCFQTGDRESESQCLRSCTPGVDGPCNQPFAHPFARARETYKWPDTECVISAGVALVNSDKWVNKYDSSCQKYCVEGAGKAVMGDGPEDLHEQWIEFWVPNQGLDICCPGDVKCDRRGIMCHCSFPDRRL